MRLQTVVHFGALRSCLSAGEGETLNGPVPICCVWEGQRYSERVPLGYNDAYSSVDRRIDRQTRSHSVPDVVMYDDDVSVTSVSCEHLDVVITISPFFVPPVRVHNDLGWRFFVSCQS